jgi:hypothetical protein
MGHSGRTFQPHCLSNALEICAVATKTVINRMAEFMNQSI